MSSSAPTRDDDLYRRLQQHLDRMPVPYPATASGVDLRILKRLFTPEDARLTLCLSAIPEKLATIRRRVVPEMAADALAQTLDGMAERGLIQRWPTKGGPLYGKSVFVVGFYEAQVNRLTPELQRDVEQYWDEGFAAAIHSKQTPQLRTVPVNAPIPFERTIGRYDDVRTYIRASAGPFAVMNCICQQGKDLLGQPCGQTDDREHCLTLGPAAQSMVGRGAARYITQDEVLAFLDRADREGLVVEPQNTQQPLFICLCCGCCCGVLTTAKKMPRPAEFFATNYFAEVEADGCDACAVCGTRCQMDAIALDDGPAVVARERCIGCGLCVSSCPTGAITLRLKSDARIPPKDTGRLYTRLMRERFGALGVVATVGRRLLGMRS
jgi:Na+-translocating ferredoxin:NAD+ oxidoreductase subunit B